MNEKYHAIDTANTAIVSLANASISVLLYNYGASNVLKVKDPSTLAGYFTRLFKGTANIAAGTVAYEAFYALSDAIINEDKSEIETAVRAYISQGMSESEAREKASLDWFAGLGDNLVYNEGIYILFALLMGNFEVTKRDYKGLKHGRNSVQLPPLSEGIVPVGTESGALVPYTHPKGGLAIPGYIGPPPQSGLTPGSEPLQWPGKDAIVEGDGGESNSPPSDVTLETNIIPNNFSVTGHIFRSKEGHIQDTAENRFLLESVANNENNFLGYDMYGNQWYALVQPDGRQVWVEARNGIIFDGGINNISLSWNPKTGLKKP